MRRRLNRLALSVPDFGLSTRTQGRKLGNTGIPTVRLPLHGMVFQTRRLSAPVIDRLNASYL